MNGLNKKQLAAVNLPLGFHALVNSGAGTGKTSVVVRRLDYLLSNGITWQEILLLTFTNHVAREMLSRASAIHPEAGKVSGGTFHSLAVKILRQHWEAAEVPKCFNIIDTYDSVSLIREIVKALPEEDREILPTAGALQKIISSAANRRLSVYEVAGKKCGALAEIINEQYKSRKKEESSLDFDDLLDYLLAFVKTDPGKVVLKSWHQVLVDEYQDVNSVQTDLLVEFAKSGSRIYAVGDPGQSIYGFRGARISSITNFSRIFRGANIADLDQNYRSSDEILGVANIIAKRAGLPKDLRSGRTGECPVLVRFADQDTEAKYVSSQIERLIQSGVDPGEIAVLARSGNYSSRVELALAAIGIMVDKRGGVKLSERRCIKDLAAFVRIWLNDAEDPQAWRRVLGMVKGCGLGPKVTEQILSDMIKVSPDGQIIKAGYFGLVGYEPKGKNSHLGGLLKATLFKIFDFGKNDPAHIGKIVRAVKDYLAAIAPQRYEAAARMVKDLELMCELACNFSDLQEFLDSVSLEGKKEEGKNLVIVSTVHSAKGLEWEYVFIVGAIEGVWPGRSDGPESLAEEFRLGYVAVTRAKAYLTVCAPNRAQVNGQYLEAEVSRVFKGAFLVDNTPGNCYN